MTIKKNKNGTYDITEVSLGKLMAVVNAIDDLQTMQNISAVQTDVRDIIKNNPDYNKDTK